MCKCFIFYFVLNDTDGDVYFLPTSFIRCLTDLVFLSSSTPYYLFMVSVIQLQASDGEQRRATPRDSSLQTTNSNPGAQTAIGVLSAQFTTPSTQSLFSTSSFSSPAPSSSTSQQSSYSNSDQALPPYKDTKFIIVFGVVGGILGLLLLGLIAFRLVVRRYQQHNRPQNYALYNSFWGKWDWRTYSPVDQVTTTVFPTDDQEKKVVHNSGTPSYYTWFVLRFFPSDEMQKGEGKKEKKKSRALSKVKRCKPSEDFDIDSCTPLSSQKSQVGLLKGNGALRYDVAALVK